jgi:hypothetical protein
MCPVSCTFPATITGGTPAQTGVIRCYLRALSDESPSEMRLVMPAPEWRGDSKVTNETFRYTAAARSGTPTVTIRQNGADSAFAFATIRYADGKVDDEGVELVNPTSADGFRMADVNG